MALQIDPRFPVVWRSPTALQIGVDRPVLVLEPVTGAQERIVSTLVGGVTRTGLTVVARAAGIAADDVERTLGLLEPALKPDPGRELRVVVVGAGLTAARIAEALRSDESPVVRAEDAAGAAAVPADLAVAVGHYVLAPVLHGLWLRRDVPHLPVILGDGRVRVGPLIEPGVGPCLYCLERHRTDAEPAWPAMAAQLWGRVSPADQPLIAGEVAGLVGRLVRGRPNGQAPPDRLLELEVSSGRVTARSVPRHPACGCAALPENGSAAADRRDAAPPPPRTGTAAAAPG